MKYVLFTTTRCPKCPDFKIFVSQNVELPGKILDETMPEFSEKIGAFGVTNAPTIIFLDDQDQEVFRSSETYEITDYLKTI